MRLKPPFAMASRCICCAMVEIVLFLLRVEVGRVLLAAGHLRRVID